MIFKMMGVATVIAIPFLCQAQQTRESRSSLVLHSVLREGTNYLAQIDSAWLAEGDLVQLDNGRLKIKKIALDHIVIDRNGTERIVKLGESLNPGNAANAGHPPTTQPMKQRP
jgi:hypothetical protein